MWCWHNTLLIRYRLLFVSMTKEFRYLFYVGVIISYFLYFFHNDFTCYAIPADIRLENHIFSIYNIKMYGPEF